jgi:hypothetical protein
MRLGGSGECMRNLMKREYDFPKARRGPVIPVPKGKTRVTIRLDEDVLAWFRGEVETAAARRNSATRHSRGNKTSKLASKAALPMALATCRE